MKWLQEHMQNHLTKKPVADDLELLKLAADVMRRNDDRKAESEARAQTMVTHAQEELRIVERLLQTSETARIAAELEAHKSRSRLEEAEKLLEIRLELAEQERAAIDLRAKAAEQRAREAEEGLERLQTALRSLFKHHGQDLPEFAGEIDAERPSA
jgi:hypothetical protein